jgi:hypothetical protein
VYLPGGTSSLGIPHRPPTVELTTGPISNESLLPRTINGETREKEGD